MGQNTFFPKDFYGSGSPSAPHHSGGGGHSLLGKILGGPAGLISHLGSDVKDAVVGLPTGATQLVEHPGRSVKAIARTTWHDWAPLVEGHPVKFLQQTYEHPLAPLLDVATVFSAGAGAAGKIGKVAEAAGSTGRLTKAAADLGKASTRMVHDTKAVAEGRAARPDLVKSYGRSAGQNLRRNLANRALLHLEPHLPAWFNQTAREGRLYDRLHNIDVAHRVAAKNLQINAIMRAGKAVSDPSLQHIIQPELLSHNYWNLRRFAHEVDANAPLPAGYRYVKELTSTNKDALFAAKPDVTLESRMRTFGDDFTTSKTTERALVKGGKKTLIVPLHDAKNLAAEGANSTKFLRTLAHKPVVIWKRINVGYAPRVITNNAVGNWLMHAMRTGGEGGGRGFVDAIKYAHGNRAAMKAFTEMRDAIARGEVPLRPVQVTGTHTVESLHENPLPTVAARHGEPITDEYLPPIRRSRSETRTTTEPNPMTNAEAAAKFTALAHPALTADPNVAAIEKVFGKRAANAVKRPPNWQKKFFADELGNVFGNVLEGRSRASQGLYPIVHRVADEPVRVAALYQFMRRAPEVQQFVKAHPGISLDEAINKVLSKNPKGLRDRAVQHVRSIAGDYTTMGPHERIAQNIVPFYLWDKHIAKHFANMVSEKPGRVVAMQQVSRMGNDEAQKLLGALPSFMEGALPLSLFGMHEHNQRTPILMTTGLNPYHTVGDLADFATAISTRHDTTSGAEAASQLSPLLSGLIEQFSGHKLGSQAPPASHGGIIPSVLADTVAGTSYGTLLQRILGGTPQPKSGMTHVFDRPNPKPFLYEKTPQETTAGLFGLPIKNVSLARAHQMADQEQKRRKTRKGVFTGTRRKGVF